MAKITGGNPVHLNIYAKESPDNCLSLPFS
jgi:hypothetical protein